MSEVLKRHDVACRKLNDVDRGKSVWVKPEVRSGVVREGRCEVLRTRKERSLIRNGKTML